MNELDVLRREFEAVPEPRDETVAAARAALLATIERSTTRPRRPLKPVLAAALVTAAALAAVLAVALPRGSALTGEEIAAAANRAVIPPPDVIRHFVIRYRNERPSRTGAPFVTGSVAERWVASGDAYAVRWKFGDGEEFESTRCGSIHYDPRANLVMVGPGVGVPGGLRARRVRIRGPVRYRGTTSFRGAPAYWLVLRMDAYTVVWIVRRNTYYPLRKTVRFTAGTRLGWTYVQNFSFEDLGRSRTTEHLLHVAPHPDSYLLRTGRLHPPGRPGCRGFGSYEQVTGEKP